MLGSILMGSVLFGLGLIYSIIPSIIKKSLNRKLGILYLVLTVIGGFGLIGLRFSCINILTRYLTQPYGSMLCCMDDIPVDDTNNVFVISYQQHVIQ